MKKKIIAFGMALTILGTLAACGGSKKGAATTPDNKGSAAGSAMGGQGYGGSSAAPAPAPSSGGTGY